MKSIWTISTTSRGVNLVLISQTILIMDSQKILGKFIVSVRKSYAQT